jgi:hypothetical protein
VRDIINTSLSDDLECLTVMPDETIRILTGGDIPDESSQAPDNEGAKIGAHTGLDWSIFVDPPNESAQKQVTTTANKLGIHNVSIKKLEKELTNFIQMVGKLFDQADLETEMKSFDLSEIELSVAINQEGSFSLVGMGAKVADTRTVLLRRN